MKKIAIAVAAAMTAATASAMDFTLYGIVDTGLGYTHVNTLDEPTENRFEEINGYNSGSRFGFKGTEDLGNGYSVSFVLENGFSSDSGALGQGGRMFGREAQVKFHSPYGTLSFGRAGTLLSGAGTLDIFGMNADVLPGGWDGIFNIGNYQGNGMRLDNMVTYQTPTAAGFTGYLQYSFANDTVAGDDNDSRANERNSNRYFAAGLTYNNGPLGVVAIYDTLMFRHYSGDNQTAPSDQANVGDSRTFTLGGHYDFGVVKLTAYGQYVKGARDGFADGVQGGADFWSSTIVTPETSLLNTLMLTATTSTSALSSRCPAVACMPVPTTATSKPMIILKMQKPPTGTSSWLTSTICPSARSSTQASVIARSRWKTTPRI